MPQKLERALKRAARKKFGTTKSRRARAYIWGNDKMQAYLEKKK